MLVWLLLCYVLPTSASQLDKLIQFVHGNGANPSIASSSRGSPPAPARPAQTSRYAAAVSSAPTFQPRQPGTQQLASASPEQARAPPIVHSRPDPPIPFSDYAPDSKLRVSQPRAPFQSSTKPEYSSKPSRTQFSGRLPVGAVQIAGTPVQIIRSSKPKSVTKPQPATRPQSFSTISRPATSPSNRQAPRPVPVHAQPKLPVIDINNPFNQPDVKEYRPSSQPLNSIQRPSSNRGQSFIQADDAHRLALEEHNAQIEKVKRIQTQHPTTLTQPTFQQNRQNQPLPQPLPQPVQQSIPQPIQNSYSKPVVSVPSLPTSSHFNIPGRDTHSQYAAELKLAQDALRSLG